MPVFNVTIPDSSPLIQYTSGQWLDTPKTDSQWQQYQNQSFHSTNVTGATATLTFNGSAVYIFGARRPEYGEYSVTLDSGSPSLASANAATEEFNVLLFSATTLDVAKQHQVVFGRADDSSQGVSVDIDYIVITAGDGNAQTMSQDMFWDDQDPRISYASDWVVGTFSNYTDSTTHITYTQGAVATVTFEGTAIALYGTVNNDHGLFSVSIDGNTPTSFDGFGSELRFQMLLYYASGLPSGRHTLSYTNISPATADRKNGLDLDMIQVSSWPESNNSTSTPQNSSGSSTNTAPGLPPSSSFPSPTNAVASNTSTPSASHAPTAGVIAGATVAATVGVAAICIALFLYWRRRHRRGSAPGKEGHRDASQETVSPMYSQAPGVLATSGGTWDAPARLTPNRAGQSPMLFADQSWTTSTSVASPQAQTTTGPSSLSAGTNSGVNEKLERRSRSASAARDVGASQSLHNAETDIAPPPYA